MRGQNAPKSIRGMDRDILTGHLIFSLIRLPRSVTTDYCCDNNEDVFFFPFQIEFSEGIQFQFMLCGEQLISPLPSHININFQIWKMHLWGWGNKKVLGLFYIPSDVTFIANCSSYEHISSSHVMPWEKKMENMRAGLKNAEAIACLLI